MRIIPFLFVLAVLQLHAADVLLQTAPVQTAAGPVIGEINGDVRVFRGIPYAKPPVGDLRWTQTQPPAPWTAPRVCVKFSPVCPQPTVPLYGDLGPSSEDCLYLNVWSAAKVGAEGKFENEKRPVLFWIHGGGFGIGAASQRWYDGSHLALDGAIIVSCNYRLGPFGFMAHPVFSWGDPRGAGNYGLRDMAQALIWTHDNIAHFGGDPDNITVWGESAGAAAVDALLVSRANTFFPFQRAIIMSTNTIAQQRYYDKPNSKIENAAIIAAEIQSRLAPCGPNLLAELRAKSAAEILKAARPGSAIPGVSTTDNLIVDGFMLTEPIADEIKAGNMLHIPLMIGNVADEGSMFERKLKFDSVAKYKEFLTQRFGAKAEQAFAIYPAATDADVRSAMTELFSDIFIRSTNMHAYAFLKPDIFVYHFTRKAKPMLDSGWGVYHGSEVPYFFGTVDDKEKYTDEDRELSRLIRIYILAFAKSGNPNASLTPRAPDWPAFKPGEERHIVLDTPISTGEKLHAKTLDALQKLDGNP